MDQPLRSKPSERLTGELFPPAKLPLFHHGQLRKTWHYISFWSPELSFCAARARVGPLPQEYWGIWDRSGKQFRTRSHVFGQRVDLEQKRVRVHDGDVEIDVVFEGCTNFEVYRPAKRAYIWSHKDYCSEASGTVSYEGTRRSVSGVVFVDVNAGYHERHTNWRWAAGAGVDQHGRLVAFNAITGLFDTPFNSERTIWIDGEAKEIGPNTFAEDLSTVSFSEGGTLRFEPEALIEHNENFLVIRSDYLHWFGTYSGTLPGGIELREAHGVRERHDVKW